MVSTDKIEFWEDLKREIECDARLNSFLASLSNSKLLVVEFENSPLLIQQQARMCHPNVRTHVETQGGLAVFGWTLHHWKTLDDTSLLGAFSCSFHCNWMKPDKTIVSITPEKYRFHLFLPDPCRSYDFQNDISYNNRVIYLDEYKPPKGCEDPERNVSYFSSGNYIDQDSEFEYFKIPKTLGEPLSKLPDHLKSKGALSYEARKWLSLRYALPF